MKSFFGWLLSLFRKPPPAPEKVSPYPGVLVIDTSKVVRVIPVTRPYKVNFGLSQSPVSGMVTASCGHQQSRSFALYVNEQHTKSYALAINPNADSWNQPCVACYLQSRASDMAVCTLCGELIAPGDGVALLSTLLNAEQQERAATDEHGQYLCCLGFDCVPSAGFFAGTWNGSGVDSPFQHGSVMAEVFQSGRAVIGRIGDPNTEQ